MPLFHTALGHCFVIHGPTHSLLSASRTRAPLADTARRNAPVRPCPQADDAFEGFDLTDLEDESGAFDLSRGVWRQGPWQELDALRRKLEARGRAPAGPACLLRASLLPPARAESRARAADLAG